jgi:hypothetical protein
VSEYVKVNIQAEERVQYNQDIEIKREDFDRLNAMLDSDDRHERKKAEKMIGEYIDRRDVFGSFEFELDDFIVVEDDKE